MEGSHTRQREARTLVSIDRSWRSWCSSKYWPCSSKIRLTIAVCRTGTSQRRVERKRYLLQSALTQKSTLCDRAPGGPYRLIANPPLSGRQPFRIGKIEPNNSSALGPYMNKRHNPSPNSSPSNSPAPLEASWVSSRRHIRWIAVLSSSEPRLLPDRGTCTITQCADRFGVGLARLENIGHLGWR